MDMIHGTWDVLFNLYLLSDRIGRKASFILGDGVGALISQPRERVHLFSVGGSLSTAVGMVGSLIAASHPAFVGWFGGQLPAYRAATLIGVVLWFVSLIPALMLREQPRADAAASTRVAIGLRHIRHPGLVARLATTGALLSVGYRLGKVRGVTVARLAAVPVVLGLGLAPESAGEVGIGLAAAGMAIAPRAMLLTISLPIAEAFAMEVLRPATTRVVRSSYRRGPHVGDLGQRAVR